MEWYKPKAARIEMIGGVPTFFPIRDAYSAAMEASSHARQTGLPVRLVVDDRVQEIGPKDVLFNYRPMMRG